MITSQPLANGKAAANQQGETCIPVQAPPLATHFRIHQKPKTSARRGIHLEQQHAKETTKATVICSTVQT
jgi:hypothetical protein